jgi:hypothetical protein
VVVVVSPVVIASEAPAVAVAVGCVFANGASRSRYRAVHPRVDARRATVGPGNSTRATRANDRVPTAGVPTWIPPRAARPCLHRALWRVAVAHGGSARVALRTGGLADVGRVPVAAPRVDVVANLVRAMVRSLVCTRRRDAVLVAERTAGCRAWFDVVADANRSPGAGVSTRVVRRCRCPVGVSRRGVRGPHATGSAGRTGSGRRGVPLRCGPGRGVASRPRGRAPGRRASRGRASRRSAPGRGVAPGPRGRASRRSAPGRRAARRRAPGRCRGGASRPGRGAARRGAAGRG